MKKRIWPKPLLFGIAASLSLTAAYILLLTALNSFAHALQRFAELGFWMPLIIVGFGLQIFLFAYLREAAKLKKAAATGSIAVSGSASVGSMAACCIHHVSDVVPVIGISAATIFLTRFEGFFFALAVVSNALGAIFMLGKIQQHSLFDPQHWFLSRFFRLNMAKAFNIAAVIATMALAVSLAAAFTFKEVIK